MNLRKNYWIVLNTMIITLFLTACQSTPPRPSVTKIEATPQAIEEAYTTMAESEQGIAANWAGKTFEEFETSVYREPDTGIYIVSGDTPIADRKHLREFFENKVQKASTPAAGLVVMSIGGVDAAWADHEKHALTYCVSNTFGTRHNAVVNEMAAATNAWEAVADINFMHVAAEDGSCNASNNQVLFDVRPVNAGSYLARAFFPGDPRNQRNVLIDNSSFSLTPGGKLTLEGILRHELGHTLGFRHEHTRPDAGTCFEDSNWRELTSYDAFSVMHYPQCNGAGDWSLQLTPIDQSGAACLYGPAAGFTIDTELFCKDRSSPENWKTLVKTQGFERLRINAGHFGGNHEPSSTGNTWSDGFVDTMGQAPHFYADIGKWDKLAAGDPDVVRKLNGLMQRDIGAGQTAARRILFGTDWYMLSRNKNWPAYADNIHHLLKTAGTSGADMQRLLYSNVLDLYGLTRTAPGKNRQRLIDYYAHKGISAGWLSLS